VSDDSDEREERRYGGEEESRRNPDGSYGGQPEADRLRRYGFGETVRTIVETADIDEAERADVEEAIRSLADPALD
jgi:hypothetical protein